VYSTNNREEITTLWKQNIHPFPYGRLVCWFFFSSFVIDVAALHLPPSLLHIIKNNSGQAEQRLGLTVSTCG